MCSPHRDAIRHNIAYRIPCSVDPNDPESLPVVVQAPALPDAGRLLLIVVLLAAGALTQHRFRGISSAV